MKAELTPLFQLSREEKLQLLKKLWESIAQEEYRQPLADWKIEEVMRRKEEFQSDPTRARSWEQVKASILRDSSFEKDYRCGPKGENGG